MDKQNTKEMHAQYLQDNVIAETWNQYYQHVKAFFTDNRKSDGKHDFFILDNQKYIEALNYYNSLKLIQERINRNRGIADWFGAYSNDIMHYLNRIFVQLAITFDPYHPQKRFNKRDLGGGIYDVAYLLKQVEEKYF